MTDKKFEFTGFEQIGGYRVPRYKDLMKDYKMAGYADEANEEELLKALEKYRIRKHELMCACMTGGKSYDEAMEICSRQGYDEKIWQIHAELDKRERDHNKDDISCKMLDDLLENAHRECDDNLRKVSSALEEARDFLLSKDIRLKCIDDAIMMATHKP